jgi:hypothetical protein
MRPGEGRPIRARQAGARAACLWACGACLLGAAGEARARPLDEPLPATNLAILQRALRGAARELVRVTPLAPGARVAVRASDERAVDQEALAALLGALVEHGVEAWPVGDTTGKPSETAGAAATPGDTTTPADTAGGGAEAPAPSGGNGAGDEPASRGGSARPAAGAALDSLPLLELKVEEARVDYTRLYRAGLWGAQHVERRALGRLSARLLKPEARSVSWTGSADSTYADVVPRSELKSLEDASRPEVNGVVPVQSWTKAVEPILVGALIVGLVALFYTNRP